MEELVERLTKVIKELELATTSQRSFHERLKKLEFDHKMLIDQNYTIITQQGAVRIAIKNIKATLVATLGGFKDSVETLSRGFSTIEDDLAVTLGFTKEEIEKMTAQEYKEKVLRPLGMARSWQK